METVCHTDGSGMQYPEVTKNATEWAFTDAKPMQETITVTVHGLRRLLRVARHAYPFVSAIAIPPTREMYERDLEPKKAAELLNEMSSIWCEDDLVMSRLFVDINGKAIAHADEEVDAKAIAPWENAKADSAEQKRDE